MTRKLSLPISLAPLEAAVATVEPEPVGVPESGDEVQDTEAQQPDQALEARITLLPCLHVSGMTAGTFNEAVHRNRFRTADSPTAEKEIPRHRNHLRID